MKEKEGMEKQLSKLEKMGDPLIEINKVIDWEIFRKPIETAIRKENYEKGGRPAWDVILMMKTIMLIACTDWRVLHVNCVHIRLTLRVSRGIEIQKSRKRPDNP